MKKYIALVLAGVISIGMLGGCSSPKADENEKETTKETEKQVDKKETKEETKKETEKDNESTKKVSATELSKNPLDDQIQINGKVYTLPVDIQEFISLGFDFKNLGEFVVNPGQGVFGKSLVDAQGNIFSGVYENFKDEAVDVRETSLTEITVSKDEKTDRNRNFDVVLPGGLKYGESLEQIKAAYGEPTSVNTTENSTTVKYKDSENSIKHYVEMNLYNDKLITYNIHAD